MRKVVFLLVPMMAFAVLNFHTAFAHETIVINGFEFEGGWGTEPPLVGQLNTIVLTVTKDDQPVVNALAKMDISVKKGGITKSLDFEPEERGVYVAEIIPTQTGQYAIVLSGQVGNQTIAANSQVEIEDVEDTRSLQFPDAGGSGEVPEQLTDILSDLATQVDQAEIAAEDAQAAAQEAFKSSQELKAAVDSAYVFGMIGIGVGVAGIVIGVVALTRKDRR